MENELTTNSNLYGSRDICANELLLIPSGRGEKEQ
jgi:hypothetical protein